MGEKLYGADDILKKFKGVDKALDNLWCALDKCCAKSPINIGDGLGLYKQFYNGRWEFKSIFAGSGISFTDTGEEIVINADAQPFDCQDVLECLGISNLGNPNKFLNEQGDWVIGSGGSGTVTNFSFTNNPAFTGIVTNSTTTPNLTLDLILVDGGTF